MAKRIIIAVAVASVVLAGCYKTEDSKDVDKAWLFHGNDCCTKVVEIEGHKYVIMDGYYSGGIVHAASCKCMNK